MKDLETQKDSIAVIVTTPYNLVLLQLRDNKPGIEYPGNYSLISGWIEDGETPEEAAERELLEEIKTRDGSKLNYGTIKLLSSYDRTDRPWTEHVFHIVLDNPIENLRITEGQGLREFTLKECLNLEKLAPHHRDFLIKYQEYL